MLTAKESENCARECVRLAGLTQEQDIRERLLEMARAWMQTAMDEDDRAPPPVPPTPAGMSRSLLNIAKRSLPRLTLRGVGLASKDAVS